VLPTNSKFVSMFSVLKLKLRSKLQSWNLACSCAVITEWWKKSENGEKWHRLSVLPSFTKNKFLHWLPCPSSLMHQIRYTYLWTSYKYGWVVSRNSRHSNITQCCQLTSNLYICLSGFKLVLRSKLQSWNLAHSCIVLSGWWKKSETGGKRHRLSVLPSFRKK
jgi:hypothetical protein